jgi:integration host factor subunit beta
MNKSELVSILAKETDLPLRKSEEIVNAVFDALSKALMDGNRIEIRGFGSFEIREYGSYVGRNPKTGAQIDVSQKRLPFFKAGKELRTRVDEAKNN